LTAKNSFTSEKQISNRDMADDTSKDMNWCVCDREENREIVLLQARTVTDDRLRREQHQYTTNKKHINKQKIQQKTSFNNVDRSTSKSKVMRAVELHSHMD
jgi:hypothetical protein